VQQNAINTQYATNFQQTDRLLEQQRQTQQSIDPSLLNMELQPGARRADPVAQPAAPRRITDSAPDPELRNWANNKNQSDAGTGSGSRRREASQRQAAELKALERELAAEADSSKTATSQGAGAPPARTPGTPYGYRPVNHYFPSQANGRLGGNR
jgi:hypothetical protein